VIWWAAYQFIVLNPPLLLITDIQISKKWHFSPFKLKTALSELNNNRGKGKGKAIPLQAWRRPEGSRRLRLLDFMTNSTWRW
jgi:hypothetical protein